MTTGNARHQAAVTATTERVAVLRADITDQLHALVGLDRKLAALAGTRQPTGRGYLSADAAAVRDRMIRDDRAALRGRDRITGLGMGWLNATEIASTGRSPAPVTIPAVSVSADILFTLQDHVRRLGRAALHAAGRADTTSLLAKTRLETNELQRGWCHWPDQDYAVRDPRRHTTAAESLTSDGDLATLAGHLSWLVHRYTNRPALEALLRELDHLEETARDVIEGPAKTNHTEPCPWCGRPTLVEHHRIAGRDTQLIRCEGTHRCECDWDWCGARCHRDPVRNRHEWVNSGSQLHTWRQLRDLQNKRKELTLMETKALDALERIKALHQPFWIDADGNSHTNYVTVDGEQLAALGLDHVCVDEDDLWHCQTDLNTPGVLNAEEHLVPACTECQQTNEDGIPGALIWPCQTYRLATELDQPLTDSEE